MIAGHLATLTAAARPAAAPPPSYTGPLDLTATPSVVAYGQRAMSAAKLGNAVYTIRRDSDDATQSFNSDATTGAVDAAAISAFIGAGNGFLPLVNDQSGNGFDFPSTVLNAQYQWAIVSASAKPGIGFKRGKLNADFSGTPVAWNSGDALTLFVVAYIDASDTTAQSLFSLDDVATDAFWELNVAGNSAIFDFSDAADNYTEWDVALNDFSGLHIFEITVDASGNVVFLLDEVDLGATIGSGVLAPLPAISGHFQGSVPFHLLLSASAEYEGAAFRAVLSDPDRLAIRQNIASWYGITLS